MGATHAFTAASAPVLGKLRAVPFNAARACAGVSVRFAENINATVPATSGDEKLVPSEARVSPSVKMLAPGPCVPLLLVVSSGNRQVPFWLTQLPAGALSAICGPRSE